MTLHEALALQSCSEICYLLYVILINMKHENEIMKHYVLFDIKFREIKNEIKVIELYI